MCNHLKEGEPEAGVRKEEEDGGETKGGKEEEEGEGGKTQKKAWKKGGRQANKEKMKKVKLYSVILAVCDLHTLQRQKTLVSQMRGVKSNRTLTLPDSQLSWTHLLLIGCPLTSSEKHDALYYHGKSHCHKPANFGQEGSGTQERSTVVPSEDISAWNLSCWSEPTI